MLLVLVFVPYLTICLLADDTPHTRSLALSGWTRDLVTTTEASSDIPGATVLTNIPSRESDLAATAADVPRHSSSSVEKREYEYYGALVSSKLALLLSRRHY